MLYGVLALILGVLSESSHITWHKEQGMRWIEGQELMAFVLGGFKKEIVPSKKFSSSQLAPWILHRGSIYYVPYERITNYSISTYPGLRTSSVARSNFSQPCAQALRFW